MAGDAGVKALHAIEKLMRGCECEVKEEVLAEQKVAYKHQIELEMMHNEECLAKMILGDRIGELLAKLERKEVEEIMAKWRKEDGSFGPVAVVYRKVYNKWEVGQTDAKKEEIEEDKKKGIVVKEAVVDFIKEREEKEREQKEKEFAEKAVLEARFGREKPGPSGVGKQKAGPSGVKRKKF